MSSTVRVAFEFGGPKARYAAETLFRLLRLPWSEVPPASDADVVYGTTQRSRCFIPAAPDSGWDEPRPLVARDEGLAILHLPGAGARVRHETVPGLGFDAFYSTYACLTAPWERIDPADEVGCPIAAQGWLAANGLLEEPLVHRYADVLGETLRRAGLELPEQPPAAIVLTHDVDSNFGRYFAIRESWALLRRELREGRPSAGRRALGLARRLARVSRADPNDRWDDWAALAASAGTRPAYFVAAYGLFDRGSRRYDVPYDIRHPRVSSTLRKLASEGAEIGVHFSLQSSTSVEQIRLERQRLEDVIGKEVRSARHHWWALGRPPEATLRHQGAAGIRVDCSFGFNDRPGFRRGIAAPFAPFDGERDRPLEITALPTTVMDLAVFDGRRGQDEGVAELRRMFQIVRDARGMLVLDWHAHALNPETLHGAGPGLIDFLETDAVRATRRLTPIEAADEAAAYR